MDNRKYVMVTNDTGNTIKVECTEFNTIIDLASGNTICIGKYDLKYNKLYKSMTCRGLKVKYVNEVPVLSSTNVTNDNNIVENDEPTKDTVIIENDNNVDNVQEDKVIEPIITTGITDSTDDIQEENREIIEDVQNVIETEKPKRGRKKKIEDTEED